MPQGAIAPTRATVVVTSLELHDLEWIHVVTEVDDFTVVKGDEPDIAEIPGRARRDPVVMASGLDNEFVARFAHAHITEGPETDARRRLTHVRRDRLTPVQPPGGTLGREGKLV